MSTASMMRLTALVLLAIIVVVLVPIRLYDEAMERPITNQQVAEMDEWNLSLYYPELRADVCRYLDDEVVTGWEFNSLEVKKKMIDAARWERTREIVDKWRAERYKTTLKVIAIQCECKCEREGLE